MHAVMIIAHNHFDLLEKLIRAIDDERNDIFLHIDKKVRDFDFERFKNIPVHSDIHFVPRVNIAWGDFSQVQAEMNLISCAVRQEAENKSYDYYHLISGVDLPIKSNDEIHRFFAENAGKEFVHFSSDEVSDSSVSRLKYYHFFRRKRTFLRKLASYSIVQIERLFGVNRLKGKNIAVQKGCNWFSITGDFARYIAADMQRWRGVFKYSYCADEVFVQTMLVNSPFKDNLYMPHCSNSHLACARLIDWQRGNPYVFKTQDFEELMSSPAMFARKFDPDADSNIIDLVLKNIKAE